MEMKKHYKNRMVDPDKLEYGAVDGAVGRAVDGAVHWAVHWAVDRAVDRAMRWDVDGEVVIK